MALAETAANMWAAILPGLAGGKSIKRARWILLGAEACEASHEGGRSVSRWLTSSSSRARTQFPAVHDQVPGLCAAEFGYYLIRVMVAGVENPSGPSQP
jgi:hypothetical protein